MIETRSSKAVTSMPRNAAVAQTLADHIAILGVPPDRIRSNPPPGTATFEHWKTAHESGINCELVNRTLVDRPMGLFESILAIIIAASFRTASDNGRLGLTSGADGFVRLRNDEVRGPDVAFALWRTLQSVDYKNDAYPYLTPDIAVEVLSRSNTVAEMTKKRGDYFSSGTSIVWMVDPRARSVAVYTSVNDFVVLSGDDVLGGGEVLPQLKLTVGQLFEEADGPAR